ncbi:MAG TPA: hypothetical protein DDZ80_18205, partial [Cyanobacteria bacterium UBA8803]|nr:hypothetical protein [Cyanobacteria bacterium UBA9273]HBL60316.1 hypothetical protein [Cyanobacteria bacterium UBA8803]
NQQPTTNLVMPVNRIVLLLLIGGGLALFALSNLSPPVLSLVFLGMQTPALPLTVWIGGAIAAGAITSVCLQALSYLQGGYRRFEEVDRVPPRNRWEPDRGVQTEASEPETPYTPPNSPQSAASDWEEKVDENWDFEPEPQTATSQQGDFERDRSTEFLGSEPRTYEANQQPTSTSQSGSVYSYSYRETSKSGVGRPDVVYDANYRVINPPYQKPPEPQEVDEEEDWGFEDDEDFDFDDEGESKPKR